MKFTVIHSRAHERGYALMLAMGMVGVSMVLLVSAIRRTSNEAVLTDRNNLYNVTVAAAEAGTERVLAQMDRDFMYQTVNTDLNTYNALVPSQSSWPTQFEFSNSAGDAHRSEVRSLGPQVTTTLDSEFAGLYGMVMPYSVTSRARPVNQNYSMGATVSQTFQLARIPIFQFAIFYTMDLEVNPGAAMAVTGKVHSNGDIWNAPPATLTYEDSVTSVGLIHNDRHPDDPTGGTKTAPNYKGKHVEKVSALTLPIGTNNSPLAVRQILDPPPWGEATASPLGRQRFYNNADLIVSNSASGVIVIRSGAWNSYTPIPMDVVVGTNQFYSFATNVSFYDYREKKTVKAVELDVAKLRTWMTNRATKGGFNLNALAKSTINHELNSVYMIDTHAVNSSAMAGVRVTNGRALPNDGFTVATPQPLYVKGHYNLNNNNTTAGLLDTSKTKPAALIGDSVTVLSDSWLDSYNSGTALSSRNGANTTVNAAFLAGIVNSTHVGSSEYYSGGVENFPRFLENWSGTTLTYNGSMVVMYPSRYATTYWIAPGTYYQPPTRKWAFDQNFLDANKLPPLTPQVRKLVRGQWKILPNAT